MSRNIGVAAHTTCDGSGGGGGGGGGGRDFLPSRGDGGCGIVLEHEALLRIAQQLDR